MAPDTVRLGVFAQPCKLKSETLKEILNGIKYILRKYQNRKYLLQASTKLKSLISLGIRNRNIFLLFQVIVVPVLMEVP